MDAGAVRAKFRKWRGFFWNGNQLGWELVRGTCVEMVWEDGCRVLAMGYVTRGVS